jgi:hypothetical protein
VRAFGPRQYFWVEVAEFDMDARRWRCPIGADMPEFEYQESTSDRAAMRISRTGRQYQFVIKLDDGGRLLVLPWDDAATRPG